MKLRHKRFKNIRFNLVLTIVFTLLFPYTLLGMDSPNYRIPKNSLSYFLQNPTQKQYLETTTKRESGAVIPPLTPLDVQEAPKEAEVPAQQAQTIYRSEPLMDAQAPAKETFDFAWKKEEGVIKVENKKSDTQKIVQALRAKHARELQSSNKIVVRTPVSKKSKRQLRADAPKEIRVIQTREYQPKAKKIVISRSSDKKPLFTKALAKMAKRRAARRAEAEKLGVILPSQNGDIATVSPSLSKIQKTLRSMMSRANARGA
jgi:predicted RNA-binding protein